MSNKLQKKRMVYEAKNPRLHLKDVDLRENYLKIIGGCV